MNGKLNQKTREHLQPKGTREGPPVPTFSQTICETVFGQESFIKQSVTARTRVDSNPMTPTIPMDVRNLVTPTLAGQTLGSKSKLRPEEEVIVAQGGSMSFQPTRQMTRSWRQTPVLAKFKD